MYKKNTLKAWLYLAPSIILLGLFMIYPLVDVFIYSIEENFEFVTQTSTGIGLFNYRFVLSDPYFIQAVKNTFILVLITVPLSTALSIAIAALLCSIKKLQKFFQTVFFLPYVTNTLAVGLVFLIIFDKTPYSIGFANMILSIFGKGPIDFIDGTYAQKMFVLCFYVTWVVMPFKILILVGALQSVDQEIYKAARIDGTSKSRIFTRITLPLISPYVSYLVITGFIGAFKQYNDAVALFGVDLDAKGMNTIVGYVYSMLYDDAGGYPSYASAAAIILFVIVLTITVINTQVNKKYVHY